MRNKGQTAIEFFIVFGTMMFIFVSIVGLISYNMGQKAFEKRNYAIKEIALSLQDEINLAQNSGEGYSRSFKMPNTVVGNYYQISIIDSNYIYIISDDGRIALSLPTYNVDGQPVVNGINTISKRNGEIHLNS